nr:hemagglutinin repeat-containing protein [Pseudomonas graminis]
MEAANDLSVSAGRDINNIGSTLQAGRDLALNAGRDVNTAATQLTDSLVLNSKHTSSDIVKKGDRPLNLMLSPKVQKKLL